MEGRYTTVTMNWPGDKEYLNPPPQSDLKKRIHDFLKSSGAEGAMIADLMQEPEIGWAGDRAVEEALKALGNEGKIIGVNPLYAR